jgi:hypothetical protein
MPKIVTAWPVTAAAGNGNANNCVKDPSMTFLATGVSWNPRPASPDAVSAPYDQAIIFLAQPKTLTAYYQYNYRTNYDVSGVDRECPTPKQMQA